jgi:hypothetical protein
MWCMVVWMHDEWIDGLIDWVHLDGWMEWIDLSWNVITTHHVHENKVIGVECLTRTNNNKQTKQQREIRDLSFTESACLLEESKQGTYNINISILRASLTP